MRYIVFILALGTWSLSLVSYASESKSESASPVQHTPHPPHDHPNNDHTKKLDEGLRRLRKGRDEEES